ncbi:MAG: sulfatase family protein [Planctomycetota bacterium]|jgi:uncharacterized sulfatase
MAMRKNVLFITSDQQHWNTMGYLNPEVKTPNLDRLAKMGTVFDRAYTVNPTCTPTRASWITGTFPSQHGAYSLGTKLDESTHVVGEDFQDAGYRTALVGKAHFQPLKSTDEYPSLESYPIMQDLDYWRDFTGPFYGFERVELARNHTDEGHAGQHYALWMEEKGCHNWRDYYQKPGGIKEKGDQGHWAIPEEFHYDAWIADRTNALMEEYAAAGDNFFLWASFFDPHPPYLAPAPWDTMYDPAQVTVPSIEPGEHEKNPPHLQKTQEEKPDFTYLQEEDGNACHGCSSHLHDREVMAQNIATYYGMISLMDKYIGKILDRLDGLGLTNDTLVVFTTDHGHFFGHHGLTAKGPFHYEDMVKVPLIASLPGAIPAGEHCSDVQSLVDLAPTFLGYAGLDVPRCMTGLNMEAAWSGREASPRDHAIVENRHQPTTIHMKTYVDARYKLTVYWNQPYGELFDLIVDPGEVNNLWDDPESQSLRAELTEKLLFAEMGNEPVPMPRIHCA